MNEAVPDDQLTLAQVERIAREVFEARSFGGLRLSRDVTMTFEPVENAASPHPVVKIGWSYAAREGTYEDHDLVLLYGTNDEIAKRVAGYAAANATQALQTVVLLGAAKMGYDVSEPGANKPTPSGLVIAG